MNRRARELIDKKLHGEPRVSQSKLADQIGIAQATIHKILYTNTNQTLDTLQKLADYFRKDISYFLSEEERPSSGMSDLSDDEAEVIRLYRMLKEQDQARARTVADYLGFQIDRSKGSA